MRVVFEHGNIVRVEIRCEEDYQYLLEEAEDLFEVPENPTCERMARVLANRLMALHEQAIFIVSVEVAGRVEATVRSGE